MNIPGKYVCQFFLEFNISPSDTVSEYLSRAIKRMKEDNEKADGFYVQDVTRVSKARHLIVLNVYHNYESMDDIYFRGNYEEF